MILAFLYRLGYLWSWCVYPFILLFKMPGNCRQTIARMIHHLIPQTQLLVIAPNCFRQAKWLSVKTIDYEFNYTLTVLFYIVLTTFMHKTQFQRTCY
jgi:hypothetical protein